MCSPVASSAYYYLIKKADTWLSRRFLNPFSGAFLFLGNRLLSHNEQRKTIGQLSDSFLL